MKKIGIVFSTRPDFIKLYPLIKEFQKHDDIQPIVILTGQHEGILFEGFEDLTIDHDLKIMKKSQSLDDIVSRSMFRFGKLLKKEHFDLVLVHGDVSGSLGVALSCFHNDVPVGHVEAGLRTHEKNPHPEETNRLLLDRLSTLWFCPTDENVKDVLFENMGCMSYKNYRKSEKRVFCTGNTVVDSLGLLPDNDIEYPGLPEDRKHILLTVHRRENHDRIGELCDIVKEIIEKYPDVDITIPVHPNPKVKKVVYGKLKDINRVWLREPFSYPEMIRYMKQMDFILSDSGGLSEECSILNIPILILRDVTERPEVINSGKGILVGMDRDKILHNVDKLLNNKQFYGKMKIEKNLYGTEPSKGIVKIVKEYLDEHNKRTPKIL